MQCYTDYTARGEGPFGESDSRRTPTNSSCGRHDVGHHSNRAASWSFNSPSYVGQADEQGSRWALGTLLVQQGVVGPS